MSAGQIGKRIGLMVLVAWSAAWMVLPANAADDPAALRRRLSALNDVTGDDPIKGEIKALLEDPKGARGLLAEAARMAKEKDAGFTYNGAYILAWAALQLRELETSRTFFRICAEEGSKLQSAQKLVSAYSGLMAIIEVLYQEKKYEQSVKLAQEFLELLEKQGVSARIKAEVYRQMIRSLAKQGKVEDANRLVETLVKAREDWQNYEIKAWLEQEGKHFDLAAKSYEEALKLLAKDDSLEEKEKEDNEDQVRRALLRALVKAGKIEEANKAIEKLKKGWQSLELKAWLQQETGHPDQAAKTYEDMLEQIGKDANLKDEQKKQLQAVVRYTLSGVYIDAERVDKAAEQLKILLADNPDNPTFNNDLGYIWADHDMHLDEAEKMIRKALEEDRKQRKARPDYREDEDKDNAAYLDSMGWVLFKKKQYPEAKKYLLQATKDQEGQHIEIMDHLADVHLALGEKAEATAVWKKALEVETNSKREEQKKAQVEKKLKMHQQ